MKNHYFCWDQMCGWDEEATYDDWISDDLKCFRAGKDFFPGRPIVLEMYHVSAYDLRTRKYINGPASITVVNVPKLSKNGKITSTAKWPYETMEEFWEFFKNTNYQKFISEHWAKKDFATLFPNTPDDIQVLRLRFRNI